MANTAAATEEFYVVDLRPEWANKPYVTFWRRDDAGYTCPLLWAGRYSKEQVDSKPGYYHAREAGEVVRFPVPCHVVEALATSKPGAHIIDGDVGPVVPNTPDIHKALRGAKYNPEIPMLLGAAGSSGDGE